MRDFDIARDIDLNPLSHILGLCVFCCASLFIRSLPLLLIYLCIPLLGLFLFNPHVLKPKHILLGGLLLLAFVFLIRQGGRSCCSAEMVNTMRALVRFFIFTISGLLIVFTLPVNRFIELLEGLRIPFFIIFVLTVALRFFPLMLREINLVKESAYGRGAVRWKGFFRHPYRSFRALFIPIVIRSLKRADSLAVAATVRGFGAPVSRTSLYTLCLRWKDYLFLSVVPGISCFFLLFDAWIVG